MFLQLIVFILVCLFASLVALTIAGVSLSIFARVLKRADSTQEEQQL